MLALAASGAGALWLRGPRAFAQATRILLGIRAGNGGTPFAGDGPTLTTIGVVNTTARVDFILAQRSPVTFDVLQTGQGVASEQPVSAGQSELSDRTYSLGAGEHALTWTPASTLPARTYILRVTAGAGANAETSSVVARLIGVDAAFGERSARPGDTATLVVRSDARSLTIQMLQSGPETEPTYADDLINGVSVGNAVEVDWSRNANAPAAITLEVDSSWAPGVYFARLTADDGRLGFAPLVVRSPTPRNRIAVVMPTSTWGAYNFYDANGDGWGDTWYARWRTQYVDLTRPNPDRGVPYRYRSYDLSFQHWLAQTGKLVDVYADEDLEAFGTPAALRAAYDLLVFPGHTEYVTEALYDLVEGYRDRGGNLMFLSANNFFRKVVRNAPTLHLIDEWRNLGRPEAALLGVQYIASDRGERHAPFTVVGADAAPWAFEGTGLENGSTFGVYGIEIDARAPSSPQAVQVLATIPDLFGPGKSAEMTYYESWSGARVFSAGALNFGGQVLLWPETAQLVENVWKQLAPAT